MKRILITGLAILLIGVSNAQKDTTGKGGIDIVSSFKPVLRQTAKINFSATPPPADTTKPKLNYDIPNQNLLFAYQPGTLKPLAMDIDSGGRFDNSNYIKAGFGSLRTPFVQAGFSFGDGKTAGLNIYARHVASDGKRENQKFTNTDVAITWNGMPVLVWNRTEHTSMGMNHKPSYSTLIPSNRIFRPLPDVWHFITSIKLNSG